MWIRLQYSMNKYQLTDISILLLNTMLLENDVLCENAAHMIISLEYKFSRIHTLYNQGDWQVGKTQPKLFYCQQTSTALICNIKQPHKGAEIKCHDRALNDNSSCQHNFFLYISIGAACRWKQTEHRWTHNANTAPMEISNGDHIILNICQLMCNENTTSRTT